MNTYVESKQYNIISKASKTITLLNDTMKSHINCYIPNLVTSDNKNILFHTVKICHLEIPYSFYIVNHTNNKLVINGITVIVPVGNYNALTLMETLSLLFSEYELTNYVFSFNGTTGKYSLTSNVYFSINSSSTIQSIIGLDEYNYNSIFNIATSKYVLEFPYQVNCSGSRCIYIRTNIITSNLNVINNDSQIIKSIPIEQAPYGIIQFNNNQGIETVLKNREMNSLEIELLDDNLEYIDLNNQNFSICLEIKTSYQLVFNNSSLFQLNDENK